MTYTIQIIAFVIAVMSLRDASAGQFKKALYYRAGQEPFRVVSTQLTDSGNVDLVMADRLSNQIVTLLGNGDGTFQKPIKFSFPAPIGLAPGDFNEDGKQDLAVVENGGTGHGALAIFLGDGKGHFHQSASYELGIGSVAVAVGDLNGDGHLDAAVADFGADDNSGDVTVLFGDGRGKLRKAAILKDKEGPASIAVSDLNGDHHPDLAVTQFATGSAAVFLNDGTGKFLKPKTYSAGGGEAIDVKIADLRNDGKQDLVIANLSQGMVVLLNRGDGSFGKPTIYTVCGNGCVPPEACAVADFDLGGFLDIACVGQTGTGSLFFGNGKGGFGAAEPFKYAIDNQGGYSIAAGDFNNDGAPDLAIPIEGYGKVAILLNTK